MWFRQYWVDLCHPPVIMFSDECRSGHPVTNFSEHQSAMRQCKTNFIDNIQWCIVKTLMKENRLCLEPLEAEPSSCNVATECDPNIESKREKTCFEKLETQIQIDQLKKWTRCRLHLLTLLPYVLLLKQTRKTFCPKNEFL